LNRTIIYHKNCFDGICAAWVINKRFPHSKLRAFSYDMKFLFNEYGKEDQIIIVDFSFKKDIMLAINEQCGSLLVIDHHKTAEKECEGLEFCHFDMNESGASLAWKFFFPNKEVPRLVQYIRDRDLWKFELPNSEIINSFIQSFPMDVHEYEMLYQNLESTTGMLEAQLGGTAINRYKDTMVKAICENAKESNFFDQLVDDPIPMVNTSILFSEVGHELCKIHGNRPFAAYYFDRVKDGVRQYGLRSIGDFDVSEVAKKFGGGGHKNSAGFEQKLSEI